MLSIQAKRFFVVIINPDDSHLKFAHFAVIFKFYINVFFHSRVNARSVFILLFSSSCYA